MRQLPSSILFPFLLALPLFAQEEALHGTWDSILLDDQIGEIATSMTFEEDGAFEISQVIEVKDDFLAGLDIPETIAINTITARGTGTYGVEGDSLRVEVTALDRMVDGENFIDFFTQVALDLSRYFADQSEIPEERYPEFEEAFVAEFLATLDEIEFLAGFEQGGSSAYAIEGNSLRLISAEETTWEFHRMEVEVVDPPTAVAGTTWGELKTALGR